MSEQGSPPTGSIEDLNQEEGLAIPIPVSVPVVMDGPVQVHLIPSVASGSRSFTSDTTSPPIRVGNEDPRRRSLTIMSMDADFYIGETPNDVASQYCAKWPKLVALTITHKNAVYVRTATTGEVTSTIVSAITETWAD